MCAGTSPGATCHLIFDDNDEITVPASAGDEPVVPHLGPVAVELVLDTCLLPPPQHAPPFPGRDELESWFPGGPPLGGRYRDVGLDVDILAGGRAPSSLIRGGAPLESEGRAISEQGRKWRVWSETGLPDGLGTGAV